MAKIREPINLRKLMEEGVVFDVSQEDAENIDTKNKEDKEYEENVLKFINMEISGDISPEDTYVEGQPFENIASKMFNLLGNGRIKKRIIREGYGNKPADMDIVRIHYHAYIEYQPEPFDSTYARRKVHQFSVNNGEVIAGLDIAVQSMRLNEKSQFIVQPEYAYGKLGCLNRVPGNAEVLFEVELLEIVSAGAAAKFQQLPDEKQRDFPYVYEYCLALCAKGKDIFGKNIKGAIVEYNRAVVKLESAILRDYSDQEKQQELLLRLYTNLLVCYTKTEEPKRGCLNFNKIRELVKGTDIKISAKCYFNNAKCLRMLGDYQLAKKRLNIAHRLEPRNSDILNEMLKLEEDIKKDKERTIHLSKALLTSK